MNNKYANTDSKQTKRQEYIKWLTTYAVTASKDKGTDIPAIPCEINIFKTLCCVKGIKYAIHSIDTAMSTLDVKTKYLLSFDHISDILVHIFIINQYLEKINFYKSITLLPFEYPNLENKYLHGMKIDKQTDLIVIVVESGQDSFLINHVIHLLRKDYKIKAVVSLLDYGHIPIKEMIESYGIEYRTCIKLSEIIRQYNAQISLGS